MRNQNGLLCADTPVSPSAPNVEGTVYMPQESIFFSRRCDFGKICVPRRFKPRLFFVVVALFIFVARVTYAESFVTT